MNGSINTVHSREIYKRRVLRKKIKYKGVTRWPKPNQIVHESIGLGWIGFQKKIMKTELNQTYQISLGWILNLTKTVSGTPLLASPFFLSNSSMWDGRFYNSRQGINDDA